MKNLVSFIVGFIFAIGLGISGMTQPAKVVGFLDLFGHWDPSLMFVMMGAIAVHALSYRLIRRRRTPLLATEWQVPSSREISGSLLVGAFIFGIGWGLGGYCPGPAVTALASLTAKPFYFVVSMIAGMLLHRFYRRFESRKISVGLGR
jgi:uncharacterized protein